MTWRVLALRGFRFAMGTAIVASFVLLVSLQVRQRIFRHRAELLLVDVQALEFQKSTWTDTETLMTRWGAYGRYSGTCDATSCNYRIHLEQMPPSLYNVLPYLDRVIGNDGWDAVDLEYRAFYGKVGGLTAAVEGEFIVEDGLIQRKAFSVAVNVAKGSYKPDGPDAYSGDYMLLGRVSSQGSLLTGLGSEMQMASHPDYKIGSPQGCENCIAIDVVYSPDIDVSTSSSLMAYNLSCLVGPAHCFEALDLLPFAGKVQVEDWTRGRDLIDENMPCMIPPEVLGRDLPDIDIVDAITDWPSSKIPLDDGSVRVVSVIRGSNNVHPGDLRPLFSGWKYTKNAGLVVPTTVQAGHRYIFFDFARKAPQHYFGYADLENCGAISYSDATLEAIQRGVRRFKPIRSEERSQWGIGWFYDWDTPH